MPIGYVLTVSVMVLGLLLAVRPLARSGPLGRVSWFLSAVPNESPFVAIYWVLAATLLAFAQGDLDRSFAWPGLALAALGVAATAVVVRRSLEASPAIARALEQDLGTDWRPPRLAWARILLFPVPWRPRRIRRFRNISYGDAGRRNRLDVYRLRSRPTGAPILIHLHGGHFRTGRKSFEGRPLLHRLATHGWICVSADYRVQPAATWPDYLVDIKKVIHWVREHAHEHGGDPSRVVVAGSSAGAHLAASAAFTANDPTFQPGFEDVDTSVAAAVGLYGYYGSVDSTGQTLPSSPADYAHPGAPPLLIAHGDQDTYVPPEHVRQFVERIRATAAPVVHVELPGAQHSFDLVHSIRFETLISGIERFAAWAVAHQAPRQEASLRRSTTGLSRSAVVHPPTV